MAKSAHLQIREFAPDDYEAVYSMYLAMELLVPHQPKTRFAQFRNDLRVSRAFPSPEHYEASAELALVAIVRGEVVAYCDGCLVNDAKGLVCSGQAFLRMVIGRPEHVEVVPAVIRQVTQQLLGFHPDVLFAFIHISRQSSVDTPEASYIRAGLGSANA